MLRVVLLNVSILLVPQSERFEAVPADPTTVQKVLGVRNLPPSSIGSEVEYREARPRVLGDGAPGPEEQGDAPAEVLPGDGRDPRRHELVRGDVRRTPGTQALLTEFNDD